MRKILLGMFFMAFAALVSAQSQRMVFMEEFTQASCPPCEQTTPALNQMVENNADKIVQIRYQTSWPGVDPMNADNPEEVQSRVDYYEVTGVPAVFVDGGAQEGVGVLTQAAVDNSYNSAAPVAITVDHNLNDDLSKMEVTVTITNEGTEAFVPASDDRLRVALVEEVITWPFRPGSTSLQVFEAVMKRFFTGTEGIALGEIAAGETWEMTWSDLDVPAVIYDYRQLAVVAWVQNDGTKAVANAGMSHPKEVSGVNLAVQDASGAASGGLCDYDYSPVASISNTSDAVSGDYTVNLVVNGSVLQSIEGTELAGESTSEVTFDPITLSPGQTNIYYAITSEATDLAVLDNRTTEVSIVKAGAPSSEPIQYDFENTQIGNVPAGTVAVRPVTNLNFVVVDQELISGPNAAGAYGESDKCLMVNFWQWNPASADAEGSMTVVDQFIVPAEGGQLSFDYAYTSWGGSDDRLQVQVSNDCGATFTDVFNKSGADLRTAPEVNLSDNGQYFKPNADQWVTVTEDISSFAGEDILVRVLVTTAWGDMLYMDNFLVSSPVGTYELTANESFKMFPNPTVDVANIELDIESTSVVSYQVVDLLGRTIKSNLVGENMTGKIDFSINLSDVDAGLYFVNTYIDNRIVVESLQVVK